MTPSDDPFALEWLETNGTGGFASGSVAGACTRPYHNLFLVPRRPPVDRVLLVNNCNEYIHVSGEHRALSSNLYKDVVHPEGHRWIHSFDHEPWPTWTYDFPDLNLSLRKELFLVSNRSIVVMGWQLEQAPSSLQLSVRPFMSGREYTLLQEANSDVRMETEVSPGLLSWNPYEQIPITHAFHNGSFDQGMDWYYQFHYPASYNQGETRFEDWWTPGQIQYDLSEGDTAFLIFTIDSTLDNPSFSSFKKQERDRRTFSSTDTTSEAQEMIRIFCDAGTDFRVSREGGKTIFAGYPWFTDWGRDTFIALTGLMLVPGAYEGAKRILQVFGDYISRGMVPNRFPESGQEPEYNTMDASFWYIHALGKYLSYSGDDAYAAGPGWKAVQEILSGHRQGTRFGIQLDEDGLIRGGSPETQLTWMDAKVGDHVFTPRDGKPVEIQALWIRSLSVAIKLAEIREDEHHVQEYKELRSRAIASFRERFWYDDGGYLYDVIDGTNGDDATLRPNQIYAAMFEDLLSDERRRAVVDTVQEHLLTSYGLRTLPVDHPRYQGVYRGNRFERDRAYHQGTVWPFLLGGFVSAWMRVREQTPANRKRARSFFDALREHMDTEACLGQISEIFEGDTPHHPRGCIAQAWSVAEPIRALHEEVL